ncbi:Malate/L-lactate dehydrogenase [Talaromyces proteolyticus]|uniref:Malate/L-lactate dehydrogenase n=1 Tax=Talaromyces proteolyticus TaxID=1131652 RepID=A0AAD4KI92_9EURO|nr:Malate/L-lactate dehydrogenase [Talaromyces proteolyticus]KAH8689063.1 Malate/L-lactate dehydrogenase [Talaromyces proteolyticus]
MKIKISDAEELAKSALQRLGYNASNAAIIAHHVIDSELRGYSSAGLARILSIRDRLSEKELRQEVVVTRESPATMQLDGQDSVGYLVARRATDEVIRKARTVGIGIVGANNTWYTGMLAYYAEMAAKSDLVTIIASNTSPWVAASGGYRPIFGTNPFAIGFPSSKTPVIYDIGTSKILHADVLLAQRLGTELPAESAYNAKGEFTKNPVEALEGAIAVWGGHRGSGLALAVQLLGVLAGSPALPANLEDFGFLIIAVNPANFQPIERFKEEIDHFAKSMKESPPLNSDSPLRVPFERSTALRARNVSLGEFEVEDRVVEMLRG